jgi:protein tyrosine/serine phosphatase
MRSRDLHWDGCLNVRDLGGHPTRVGRETRFGAVVRADSIRQLSDDGWRALVDYGIRTIVDLRGDHERTDDPPIELPVEVVHTPFTADYEREWAKLRPEFEKITDRREVYVTVLERFSRSVGASVRAVADAPNGGVLVHCIGGKDRTGLLAALLLHIAGVQRPAISADYAQSEVRLRTRELEWLARAESEEERAIIRDRSRTPAEAMLGVFEKLDQRFGSVDDYLRAAGATDADFERIRERLLA